MRLKIVLFLPFFFFTTSKLHALSMPAPGACPMNYSPVCGANGETYSNSCMAQNAGVSFRPGECQAQRPNQNPQDCIHCGPNPMLGLSPISPWNQQFQTPFMVQRPMPWWGYYGQQRYPNFHYPGIWSGYAMNPRPYPGQGGAFAAKPNVYLDFEDKEQEIKIELSFSEFSSHLVSAPDLSQGWQVMAKDKREIDHQGALYEYLFYDFRFDENQAQYESGFCTDAQKLIPEMIAILDQMGYSQDEQADFLEHWSLKIPFANQYCVYPQTDQELDQLVPFKAYKKKGERWQALDVQRVLFIVHLSDAQSDFPPKPKKEFKVKKQSQKHPVREWGVAFLSDQKLLE